VTKTQKRTIEEGLKEFRLINGAGSEKSHEACAMTLLAWVAGRTWTHRPPCAHPTLASIVIRANDVSTATSRTRAALVKAGEEGVLDTWWIPGVVIAWAQIRPKGAKELTSHQFAMYVLKRVAKWKAAKGLPSDLDLHYANLRAADLRYADLHYANLRAADLHSADLRYADLHYANLHSANLRYANLRAADLRYADLRYTDLHYADLRYADLRYADLRYADLRYANLRYASLHYANLHYAIGTPVLGMPNGWRLDDSGLWVAA
jgi:hypothetical protein